MKNIVRAATTTVGVGLSIAVLSAGPASATGGTHVRCNDITALRNAISQANTSGGRITLAPHCTYTLTAPDNPEDGLPEITGNVTISGRDTSVRRAPNATQAFRIFHVANGGNLTLKSLTVSGGSVPDSAGGGIWNSGTLNLNSAIIKGNLAGTGGGVYNLGGQLTLDRSTVKRNTAIHNGGGIANGRYAILDRPGTVTMKGGALLKNRALNDNGGGLENVRSTASLDSVSVRGNTALHGGGINQFGSTLRLTSTTVRDNVAVSGGGLANNASTAALVRSLVTRNTAITAGGGIFNENSGQATLTASKVIHNTPDNCSPEGSVPGCAGPANRITPSSR
ncbi:right-handed parallel beta-helix repeat-containing protein [Streptantibioticus ferralitis]|uniref:Right-handed parallel beta-helix repeat-containing protein n=1 Tax=Streptantibioticus ferralitis TaxID=236510 RepID=A0ABT5Z2B8_9ACTN|nr:right-handed parallel beta-helix repeat-containing protein [Streptantibioticus ferralitis]MDF2257807.1 right-handed parallel beta-helix repeat-containing protein [Streptantibioticus ferralitis]